MNAPTATYLGQRIVQVVAYRKVSEYRARPDTDSAFIELESGQYLWVEYIQIEVAHPDLTPHHRGHPVRILRQPTPGAPNPTTWIRYRDTGYRCTVPAEQIEWREGK